MQILYLHKNHFYDFMTTFSEGYLGLPFEEERSKVRELR